MILPCYLAMTALEFMSVMPQDPYVAWLSCHFSNYHTGLTNLPKFLPAGSMVIVDDMIPIESHDPNRICQELTDLVATFQLSGVLLDLQRPNVDESYGLCKVLSQALPCPVGVTEYYAEGLSCPVLISVPLRTDICALVKKWKGRELWLEAALEAQKITISKEGAQVAPWDIEDLPEPFHEDAALHCRYHWQARNSTAVFTVQRDFAALEHLVDAASKLGVTRAVGLYQQLHSFTQ